MSRTRPFFYEARMHDVMLEPWTGPDAWWRSPTGELWASILIAAPAGLLAFFLVWIIWMVEERHEA